MKKLAVIAAVLLVPAMALAAQVIIDTWPGIGSNAQLDALRCYSLAFAPADKQRATFLCQNGSCTARVTMPWLGGYTTLRSTVQNGFTEGDIMAGEGPSAQRMATFFLSSGGVFYVGRQTGGLSQCTYPSVAPVGRVARWVGNP
jgi:hypothetical protein